MPQKAKSFSIQRQLKKGRANAKKRRLLARIVKQTRSRDQGKGNLPYNPERPLAEAPFFSELTASIERRTRSLDQVRVLDKGAGTGRMAAEIKDLNPKKIHVTALSLANTISQAAKRKIDAFRIGIGLKTVHEQKFDIIVDCFGEDYHIGKLFWGTAFRKSVFDLKKGGDLFTVIPLSFLKGGTVLSVEEGRALARELSARKDVVVRTKEIRRRVDRIEYVDLVLHITKK